MTELIETLSGALQSPEVTASQALKLALAAFVLGQLLVWAYEWTYRGLSYSRSFAQALLLVSVTACVFVMAIGRSIYAGLGLLGVLSIVRFRANVKSPWDLVFVMAAATVGVACGVDSLAVAFVGTATLVGVAAYAHASPFGTRRRFDGVLRFTLTTGDDAGDKLAPLLARHCARTALLSVGEIAQGALVEHTYQVKFTRHADQEQLLTDLRRELHAHDARLLLQETALEY